MIVTHRRSNELTAHQANDKTERVHEGNREPLEHRPIGKRLGGDADHRHGHCRKAEDQTCRHRRKAKRNRGSRKLLDPFLDHGHEHVVRVSPRFVSSLDDDGDPRSIFSEPLQRPVGQGFGDLRRRTI
jgi:hypothetical protein